MAQLHQSGVSEKEIQSSFQNLCKAQGMDKPAAQGRMQEAFHIWNMMSTVLQKPSLVTMTPPIGPNRWRTGIASGFASRIERARGGDPCNHNPDPSGLQRLVSKSKEAKIYA
jgi:hypothetical protein